MLDKRYDPKLVEKDKYEAWKSRGYFTSGDLSKKPFSMVIPPPNVTGKLHIGHAWNCTVQDIIARYKKANGYDVLWLPGMDHAGIATQAKVMEKLRNMGKDVTKITREEFLEWAWAWKNEYAESIREQWAKLGFALDYNKERFTLDEGLNYAVRTVFVNLYNKGLIYQGEKIINWDPVQMTALSNIEVIHQDDPGFMYYFKYRLTEGEEALIVATTRPETMFGDVCVVVNPTDERYKHLIGKKVINPANHEIIPIIADEYVDITFGTGAMKCTPAHDPNDFVIGEKYQLPRPIIFNKNATMNEKCGVYQGMDRFDCRQALLKAIEEDGNFVKKEAIVHPVGHSERSRAVIEPMLSKQWFVKMRPLAENAMINQENEQNRIEFIPERFEKVFLQWMEKAEDWCISRQLWWGHRIPAYYNVKTGEMRVLMEAPDDQENWVQESDVLDTWFSSALWPFSTLGWPNKSADLERYFPTDVLATAYDIIFFWVSRMIFQSLEMNNLRPFKQAVIHGLVRDELGRKMSKSLGNGVDPLKVIEQYGADALRYFMTTNSTPGQDMRYIEEKVQASANYLNKIWNAARYVFSILGEDYQELRLEKKNFSPIDQWIINRLNYCVENVTTNMEKFDFNVASTHLYNFVYDDFCGQYLEMSKVALGSENPLQIATTKAVLLKCLKSIILLIYPYTPFIAEELYGNLPNHLPSIMEESYPMCEKELIDDTDDYQVELLYSLIRDVRTFKIQNGLAPNAKLSLSLYIKKELFADFLVYFRRFTFSDIAIIDTDIHPGESHVYLEADLFIVDNNNKEEVIAKLNKDIEAIKTEIKRCENMLSNANFLAKAPEEKVSLEKEKLAKHRENLTALEEKLANLA